MSKPGATISDPLISMKDEFLSNPYPTFARLREEAPVLWSERGKYWLVSKYDDVSAILRDLHYEKGLKRMQAFDPILKFIPQVAKVLESRGKSMLHQNPPEHTRLRSLVNKAFTPSMITNLRPHIQQIASDLLDKVEKNGEMDLITDFAFVLPVTVIAEMLGVPPEDRNRFKEWSHPLTETLEPGTDLPKLMKAGKAGLELRDYLVPLFEERSKNPKDDLITALVQAEEEGSKLTKAELLANTVLLLVAGHETTVNLIGNGMLALLRNPGQMDALKEKPDLIEFAIEEFLRYDGPVQMVRRVAGCNLELAGQKIKEHDMLVLLIGSANHDPEHFQNPDTLDITRTNNKHLAFGSGIHHCLGSTLARAEGQIAISTLIQRFPNIKLKTNNLEHKHPFALHGVKSMPVTF